MYVLVGPVIYLFRNLFVNNDCIFFVLFFHLLTIKRIETVKNRVKTELEISVKNVDVKQENWAFFVKNFDSNIKNSNKLLPNGNVFPTFGFLLTVAKMIF